MPSNEADLAIAGYLQPTPPPSKIVGKMALRALLTLSCCAHLTLPFVTSHIMTLCTLFKSAHPPKGNAACTSWQESLDCRSILTLALQPFGIVDQPTAPDSIPRMLRDGFRHLFISTSRDVDPVRSFNPLAACKNRPWIRLLMTTQAPSSVGLSYRGSIDEPHLQEHTGTAPIENRTRGLQSKPRTNGTAGAWNIDITGITSTGFSQPNPEDAPHKQRLERI